MILYKSDSDLNVTIVHPKNMRFIGIIAVVRLNFIIIHIVHVKDFFFKLFDMMERNKEEHKANKGNSVCKINSKEI